MSSGGADNVLVKGTFMKMFFPVGYQSNPTREYLVMGDK